MIKGLWLNIDKNAFLGERYQSVKVRVTAESQRSHIGGAILKNLEKSRVKMTWDF